jgi:hypothetical protein
VHLIFRFITGFCGSTFLAVAGGSVSDMFTNEKVAGYVLFSLTTSFESAYCVLQSNGCIYYQPVHWPRVGSTPRRIYKSTLELAMDL